MGKSGFGDLIILAVFAAGVGLSINELTGGEAGRTLKAGVKKTVKVVNTGVNTAVSGVSATIVGGDSYIAPSKAYNMIRAGRVSELRSKNISKYFTWGDVLRHGTALSIATLANLKNAKALADKLDPLVSRVGRIDVDNWLRNSGSATRHPTGRAIDVSATIKRKAEIVLGAIAMGWSGGIGFSRPSDPGNGHLHLDIVGGYWPYPDSTNGWTLAGIQDSARRILGQ